MTSAAPTYPKNPALEKAVIAAAEDDLPRLVYADWLDENGDPHRANFIRAQCALYEKHPADEDYPDWVAMLQEAVAGLYPRPDLDPEGLPDGSVFIGRPETRDDQFTRFFRGFPYFFDPPQGPTRDEAVRLADALPQMFAKSTIRGLGLDAHGDLVLAHPACSPMSGVRANAHTTGEWADVATVDALARSPCAPNLRYLELSPIDHVEHARVIAHAPFRRLTRFETNWFRSADVIKAVYAAPWMAGIRRLAFGTSNGPRLTRQALSAIAGLPILHTYQMATADEEVEALSRVNGFRELGRLTMDRNHDRLGTYDRLAKAKLPRLAVLELSGAMTNEDFLELASASWVHGLRMLRLHGTKVGDKAVSALAGLPVAKQLRELTLRSPALRGKSFALLAAEFPQLTTLNLSESGKKSATPAVLTKFLADYRHPTLRHLDLSRWPVDDTGAAALAKNPAFRGLRVLALQNCPIGLKGLKALANSEHLRGLVSFDLGSAYTLSERKVRVKFVEMLRDPGVLPNLVRR